MDLAPTHLVVSESPAVLRLQIAKSYEYCESWVDIETVCFEPHYSTECSAHRELFEEKL